MKRRIFVMLTTLLLLTMTVLSVNAADVVPLQTYNYHNHNYKRFASSVICSYLISNDDGTYTRVESDSRVDDEYVYIETYSAAKAILSQQRLSKELALFGGFYEGTDSYFLVYGQNNPDEDDSVEIMRVVRYSKNWERIASASVYGANTTIPFDFGSLRMVQSGDTLYIRTSHQMYKSSDGLNHQANMTCALQISDMSIKNIQYAGYASHSFNQFIDFDGEQLIAADHGDAYPRSVVLFRHKNYNGEAMNEGWNSTTYVDVLPIKGEIGDNYTGVEVGGLAVTDTHYLVAGKSIDQTDSDTNSKLKNIFLTATPKNDFTEDATTLSWFTNIETGTIDSVSNPYLIKLSGNDLVLLWEQEELVYYVFLDSTGKATSDVLIQKGCLSDCEPIVTANGLEWFVTNGEGITFYTLDTADRTQKHINGWYLEEGNWVFYENGEKVTNQWRKDSRGWCYLGSDGTMLTNTWLEDSKGWCYVGADGYCETNCWKQDSYGWLYLDSEGSMTKDAWVYDGAWYYLDENGYMACNQWRKDSKGWCYLGSSGAMLTNTWLQDSKGWCYVSADGYCETNCWKQDSYGWIYLDSEGSMTKDEWVLDGGNWYYLDKEGYMVTGTHTIDGAKYTFNDSGIWIS